MARWILSYEEIDAEMAAIIAAHSRSTAEVRMDTNAPDAVWCFPNEQSEEKENQGS